MSDLTGMEKKKFEQFLGMETGYVLNFSNRSFEEFVRDSTGIDIYDQRYSYASGSNANRLRAFWEKESNSLVGKLMGDMLEYSESSGAQFEVCRLIVARLLGNAPPPQTQSASDRAAQLALQQKRSQELGNLKNEFFQLAADPDRNKSGLALEKLLNRLFEIFELQPRQPFRVIGEQIDGSFLLDGEVYLLESKWERNPLPEADLLIFKGKIEGKSTWTRGLLIALNDVSEQARQAITRGKPPCFFVMNGHDLMMILSEAMNLQEFLRKRVRLLAEEGRMCVPFSALS
jgi:hypothetical protein